MFELGFVLGADVGCFLMLIVLLVSLRTHR